MQNKLLLLAGALAVAGFLFFNRPNTPVPIKDVYFHKIAAKVNADPSSTWTANTENFPFSRE